jgi:protein-tyrosine phosphatase
MADAPIRICFVCLGNICRSPTAEGVMKQLIEEAQLGHRFVIDSAGTGAYHVGERADARSRAEALRRGVDLTSLARRFTRGDFAAFDYIVPMDAKNERDILLLAKTDEERAKVARLCSYDRAAKHGDVPDPYYGGANGFVDVYDICVAGCTGLLAHVRDKHKL